MARRGSTSLYRVVTAYTVNQFGWWFAFVGVSLGVYNHTHSSLALGAVLAVGVLPAIFAPAVVARIEASPRRGGLSLLYAIEAVCAGLLAVVLWNFSLPAILVLVALDGSIAYAARALLRTEAARTGDEQGNTGSRDSAPTGDPAAHRANAALNVSLSLSAFGGPALAGLAVEGLGSPSALAVDAGCFLVSGALVLDIRVHVEEAAASVGARLNAAREYLRGAPMLRALIVTEIVAMVFFFCASPALVPYTKSTLHAGDLGYGILLATWGVGQVAGSLLFTRARGWLWAMLVAGTLAVGLAYLGYAAAPSLRVACVAALVGGLGNGVQWAAFLGVVQALTPRGLLGRMMGVVEGGGSIAPVLGYALGGALALVGPRIALLAAGLVASAMAGAFIRIGGARNLANEANAAPVAAAEAPSQREPVIPA